jgi:hypothetical protein
MTNNTVDKAKGRVVPRWEDVPEPERNDLRTAQAFRNELARIVDATNDKATLLACQAELGAVDKALDLITKELRNVINSKKKQLKQMEEDEDWEMQVQLYLAILKANEIYYVASEHLYYQWERMCKEAVIIQHSVWGDGAFTAFDEALNQLNRKKMSVECSFFPKPDRVLNLMRRDHWLKPQEGEPHYAFDLLTMSLGNGKKKNMDHIEQVVYWKYTHPDEFRLPCLVIYGEGGAGKNTFVKEVLGTIFGPHQVLIADADKALGQFNGLVQGKTVVMIDEAVADKVNAERLKRTVGNRTIDVNPKYGKQGEHDNTPLYFAGGNDRSGAILLANDATDRRWSILRVDKSIIQHLAEDKVISFDDALVEYDKLKHAYSDPDEVAKWLNYLIERWQHLEMPPVGLHDDDYQKLIEVQKSPMDEVFEIVFLRDDFEYIDGSTLHKLYQRYAKEVNPSLRGLLGKNKLLEQARLWNDRRKTGIEWGKVKTVSRWDRNQLTTTTAFFYGSSSKVFTDNREIYLPPEDCLPYWEAIKREKVVQAVKPPSTPETVVVGASPKERALDAVATA